VEIQAAKDLEVKLHSKEHDVKDLTKEIEVKNNYILIYIFILGFNYGN